MSNKKKISIIIPLYNEQENIVTIHAQVTAVMQALTDYDYEFIFVNDGSKDLSWHFVMQLVHRDEKVRALNFSRNFGHQAALTAGYAHAKGDAVITMDADLQDPPELLISLIVQWEQGSQIVYARRIDRKDSFLKRYTALLYYKLLDAVADVRIPRNVGDFRLLDARVVQCINKMPESARYLRGLVAWTGFNHSFVDFKRPDRAAGVTGYTWKKMFKLALDGLTGFSTMPLKIALYVGVCVLAMSMFLMGYLLVHSFLGGAHALIEWCMVFILFFMGMQSIGIWFLGEYIARMYDQQKGRPLYIIESDVGWVSQAVVELGTSKYQRELQ